MSDWHKIVELVRAGKFVIVMATTEYSLDGSHATGVIHTIHSVYDTRDEAEQVYGNTHLSWNPDVRLFVYPLPSIPITQAMEPNPAEDRFPF